MKKLLLATRNHHKQQELQEMLIGLEIEVLNLQDVPELPDITEDGTNFAANALKKAQITAAISGYICLADDSGLEVESLDNQPGVYSARFAGEPADDEANNRKLLELLTEIPGNNRNARFVCVLALALPDGRHWFLEGTCPGRIGAKPQGDNGFGYDPLFIPDGYELTFAQLSAETKNKISHRGQALAGLKQLLPDILSRYK